MSSQELTRTRGSGTVLGVLGDLLAEAGAAGLGAAQRVRAAEGDDLHVAQAHAVEHVLQVLPGRRRLVRERLRRRCTGIPASFSEPTCALVLTTEARHRKEVPPLRSA